jgi:hypothetical protein
MCEHPYSPQYEIGGGLDYAKLQAQAMQNYKPESSSEEKLVDIITQDLGIVVDRQALRMFLRHRWDRISALAHRIHKGEY